MQVRPQEIKYHKEIGTLDGDVVQELGLSGGYHIICAMKKNGTVDYLGVGPHRAVARYMARKRRPSIQIIAELAKSEDYSLAHFAHLVPRYEAMLDSWIASKK